MHFSKTWGPLSLVWRCMVTTILALVLDTKSMAPSGPLPFFLGVTRLACYQTGNLHGSQYGEVEVSPRITIDKSSWEKNSPRGKW